MEEYKTPGYMLGFQCLGGECEDSCCHDWNISVDMVRYERLAERMSRSGEERALFERGIALSDSPSARRYARIRLCDDGRCLFLDRDGWCHIHRHYGEEALAETCALFPRVLSRTYRSVELTGALSCPEVGRLCLLNPDPDAHAWQSFDGDALPTGREHTVARQQSHLPYEMPMERVREVLVALIPSSGAGLESGLMRAAWLAARLAPHYHSGCQEPGAELERALESHDQPDLVAALQRRLAETGGDDQEPTAILMIQAVFGLRLNRFPEELLSQSVAAVYMDLKRLGVPPGEAGFEPYALANVYRERRARVRAGLGLFLDDMLARWFRNTLQREWFTTMPDPFVYFQMLLIRQACLRFMLHIDPEMLAAARVGDTDRAGALAVRWSYRFARSVDHNLSFLEAIYYAANEQGLLNLEATPGLIRP